MRDPAVWYLPEFGQFFGRCLQLLPMRMLSRRDGPLRLLWRTARATLDEAASQGLRTPGKEASPQSIQGGKQGASHRVTSYSYSCTLDAGRVDRPGAVPVEPNTAWLSDDIVQKPETGAT